MQTFSKRRLEHLKDLIFQLRNPEQTKSPALLDIHLLDEKFLNMGDYVLVFSNPDHHEYEYKDNIMSFGDVSKDFDKCFDVDCAFDSINQQEELYRLAFLNSFERLNKPPNEDDFKPIDRYASGMSFMNTKQNNKIFLIDEFGKTVRVRGEESRMMGMGGFLRQNDKNWERSGEPVRDVCTLFRIFILHKLSAHGGFFVRQFLSQDGTKIFAVLYSELKNLKTEAERIMLKKRIDIAFCDILSLEPVDDSFRPLRLNYVLQDKHFEKLSLQLQEVRKEAVRLLTVIDYNKLVKECGQAPFETVDEIKQQQNISIPVWHAYIFYLRKISEGVIQIRHKYKKSDPIQLLNKEELKQLMQNTKQASYKGKSKKPYVQEQAKGNLHRRQLKELLKHKRAKEYKQMIMETNKLVQKYYGKKLLNLWDRCKTKPVGPYVEYFRTNKNKNYNQIIKTDYLWTQHVINEKGKESLFNKMERAKLVISIMGQLMNLEYMSSQDIIEENIIPNSYFDLDGSKQKDIHKKINTACKADPSVVFSMQTILKIKKQFKQIIGGNEIVAEEDQIKKKQLKQNQHSKIKGGINGNNLLDLWSLLDIPVEPLAEYFGERIALYFTFLYYFIEEQIPISFFGIVTFIVQFLYNPDQLPNKMAIIFFTFLIVFWSSTFESMWKRKEIEFQTIFGLQDIETNQIELVGFVGKPKRSIATDKMNELQFSSSTTWLRIGFGLFMVLFFIIIELVIIVLLQALVVYLENQGSLPYISFLELEVFIPALIWVLIGMILDTIFRPFAFRFTKWENHKYLSQFESSFIIKNLLFSTVNRMGSPFIIAFINGDTIGCVNGNDCYQQLQIYMRVVFFLEFGKHLLFGFVFPLLKQIYQRTILSLGQLTDFGPSLQKKSPYFHLNKVLESEICKESFTIDQVDGTIWEYLELSLQFALLSNYGSPFPIVFIMGFGMNIFELLIDKFKMIWLTKRPTPQSARTIGTFIIYLNLMSYISIFTNSALMAYTNKDIFLEIDSFTVFILMLLGFFIFKFITDIIYGSADSSILEIRQRHQNIQRKLNVGHRIKNNSPTEPSYPIFKIYGTLLSWQPNSDE